MPEKRCGKPKKYGRSAGILPAVAGASRSRPFCHPERSEGSLSFHLNFGAPHLLQLADVGTTLSVHPLQVFLRGLKVRIHLHRGIQFRDSFRPTT